MPFLRSSGKHAKPSKTAPAVVAGGMSAAFFMADGGSPASAAAPSGSWDRLAACESGGNWSINTGNGYYGGLQFNLATWRSVGGEGRPDRASRTEQIRRANILHDARGWSPWPSCSRKLGLRGTSASSGDGDSARTAERASRSRRTVSARTVRTTPVAARSARVVAVLSTTAAPAFDGRVISTADVGTYRSSVATWQRRMAARGWDIAVDGRFGARSADVARRFAAQKGLRVARPGTVDRTVWNAAWTVSVT